MKYKTTRRDFIKEGISAATVISASFTNIAASGRNPLQRTATPKKVLIIGAGLAGLSAALELTQAGHDVIVFEAQSRPGGRVRTLRAPFADGLYAEAGATRIPDHHKFTLDYASLFNLQLDLFQPPGLATVYYVRDKRLKFKSGEQVDWPFDLTPEERKLGLAGLRQKYALTNLKDIGDVLSPAWPPESLKKYDQVTVSDLRREMGISPEVEALLRFVSGASPIWSSLQAIRAAVQSLPRKQYFKIRGGNDLLPKAFAARLADKINYGAPVVRIEQDEKSVHVVIQQAGTRHTVTGDYLICAIPFTLLRNIEVAPSFSPEKRTAIEQMIFTSASKVFLQVKKRFWLDENLNGFASTDLPIGQIWNAVNEQSGTRGILLSYAAHLNSPRITSMNEEERVRFALEHMEKVYPGLHKYFEGGISHCWDDDPWARGATPAFKPGQVTTLLPHIARSEGRVHFAGDHTSIWFEGWMQCALESGNRAATEINNAPDRKRA